MKKNLSIIVLFCLLTSCGATSGGDCEPYSDWKPTEKKCEYNFWCSFANKKANYQYFEKTKQCKNGVVKKTKREKLNCGC